MLDSITIRNVATYDSEGVTIKNLKKVNFIYGTNGCGKTTISKLINNQREPQFSNCLLNWKGGLPVKALTYNKDFRYRNFGKGKMDGVFTLGQATKEEIEAIEAMRLKLAEIKDEGIKKKETLEKLKEEKDNDENTFKEVIWRDIYKANEADFKEAFRGVMKKDAFRDKLLSQHSSNKTDLLTLDVLREKAETLLGETPPLLQPIPTLEFARLVEIETNKLWKKKIIGKADVQIAALIQRLNMNDWINEGRGYIQEDATCPFCQQETITANFRKQVESFYDETFTSDTNSVKGFFDEYHRQSTNITNLLEQIEQREKNNTDTKLPIDAFSSLLKTLLSQVCANRELLNSKIKEPSRSIELQSTKEQLTQIKELIDNCNNVIKSHNAIVNDYDNQRGKLISAIWKYLVHTHQAMIEAHINKHNGMIRGIQTLEQKRQALADEYRDLNNKIKNANKNVTSVQPSVDEINRILKSYGFLNFEIVPFAKEPNKYQILREDGTIAEATLSEGEASFITFLYFLQLAKGSTQEDSITEERILVIDDPISSLDSNVLFVVSSLIKEIIKAIKNNKGSIKQLILLTHNVYFHKEVSFVDGRTPKNGDTHYWILRKNNNTSFIQAFEKENPIHTSYQLLWKELSSSTGNSGITIQNTMRRIIENYFKILGRYADDDLIQSFQSHQEQEICRSLVCWINDGSHGLPDDVFVEQQDAVIERYFDIFRRIFVEMGHEEHYNMMFSTLNQDAKN